MHRPPNVFLLVAAVGAVVIFLLHLASDGSQAAHIVAKVKSNTPTWLTPQKGTTWTTVKSSEVDDDRFVQRTALERTTALTIIDNGNTRGLSLPKVSPFEHV